MPWWRPFRFWRSDPAPRQGPQTLAPQNGLIAVQGVDGIYIVDPRTETARLVPKSEELSDPAWSPDGTTLAVTSSRADSYDVYTMKPDGNERTLVLRNALHPSWSPDGNQLVVVRRACGSTDSTSSVLYRRAGSEPCDRERRRH